ncbi:hypothetical protein CB1_001435017 [Camelus ferus]|nr:hypothetical protein CB1_001435017 [Camelus ferus]
MILRNPRSSPVCASKVDELVFFFNQKSEIDDAYWEMHVQQCVFPVTGIFLFSSSNPKGRVLSEQQGCLPPHALVLSVVALGEHFILPMRKKG